MKSLQSFFPTACVAFALLSAVPASAQQAEPTRAITHIAGDLYRFQNNVHYSVFLVTPAGIIATDPINHDAAVWLKAALAERFGVPVKYLIYSHDHYDHISGGEVFADTATVISHVNTKADIIGESRATAVPDITFTDHLAVELGGKQVLLTYLGPNHSDNSIVMHFPAERAIFGVDFVSVNSIVFNFHDAYMPDWLTSLAHLEAMDFDILVPGHGPLGTRANVTALRGYMETLYEQVLAGARAGKSLDEIKAEVDLEAYSEWTAYGTRRDINIEGIYELIEQHR